LRVDRYRAGPGRDGLRGALDCFAPLAMTKRIASQPIASSTDSLFAGPSLFTRPSLPIGLQRKLHEIIVHLTGVLLDILNGHGNKLPV
jgi:hypothetical protein